MSTTAPKLTVSPFSDNPDAPVFVDTATHRQAVAQACHAIDQDGGLVVITGEAGSGKTMVLDRVALLCSDDDRLILRLSAADIGEEGLEAAVLEAMRQQYHGIDPDMDLDKALEFCRDDQLAVVLLLDDAGTLGDKGFKALRRLVDYTEDGEPRIRAVIAGRPSLRSLFYRDEMSELRRLIASSQSLSALDSEEVAEYFDARVRGGGFSGEIAATVGFLEALATASEGNPARINRLSSRAIAAAGMAGRSELHAEDVETALPENEIEDADFIETPPDALAEEDEIPAAAPSEEQSETLSMSTEAKVDRAFTDTRRSNVTVKDLNAAIEQLSQPGALPGSLTTRRPRSPQEMLGEPSPIFASKPEAPEEPETEPKVETEAVLEDEDTDDIWAPVAPMSEAEEEAIDAAEADHDTPADSEKVEAVLDFVEQLRTQIDGLRETIDGLKTEAMRLEERREESRKRVADRIDRIKSRLDDLRAGA